MTETQAYRRTSPSNPPYFKISEYLKEQFGCKVMKLCLDGGFTCPNRDGTKGVGGCIFCSSSGSGEFSSTIPQQIQLLSRKWPNGKYIAYFQNHTNTYAPVRLLRRQFTEALAYPGVVGLAVATRPDCLPPDVIALLEELNSKTFLWVELGLQTIHDKTAELINRCYPLSVFSQAADELNRRQIRWVAHLMMGLPGETREEMLSSVAYVGEKKPFGVKLHLLHVLKGTALAERYPNLPLPSMEEYIQLAADALELLPPEITIHRLTGDGPRELLLAPLWSVNKWEILNGIDREMKRRGTVQGSALLHASSAK